jgi:Rad3-related DNA helicase
MYSTLKKDVSKFEPRTEQQNCLNFIEKTLENSKLVKFFLLDLPVGVGKSHLSIMISDWYKKNINKAAKVDIITATKILQDQYSESYGSLNNLKGNDNYNCSEFSCSCKFGKQLAKLAKKKCDACPYDNSRNNYMNGGLSLTNFYLYSIFSLFGDKMPETRKADVLILDEAHLFDDIMSDFFNFKVNERFIKRFKLPNEKAILSDLKKINDLESYIDFLNDLNEQLCEAIDQLSREIGLDDKLKNKKLIDRSSKLSKVLKKENNVTKSMSVLFDITNEQGKLDLILKEYKLNDSNWIFDKTKVYKDKEYSYSISAIWSYDFLDKYIFSKYERVFLMSGTILDKNMFCQLNGLDVTKSAYYRIRSPFDVNNRKVYYLPVGKMSYKQKEETFKKYIPYIKKILKKYWNQKGIIHTNSFELANRIKESINDPRLVFHDSSNKDDVLNEHKRTDKPTVIVSPSMDTGVSFDGDYARFQIIAKIPYPSLASKKNKMRQKSNQDWYSYKTCASLQQASGRIVRSKDDKGDTIIMDSCFADVIRYSSHYLLDWFQDSVVSVNQR